ncbi:1,4-alpha-glucan branching enzyme [Arthrobacter stackebrandtii]|uniref:Maltokinase n=1 Tax=Arthrobacter stackebrandtii TaxID=272161 RepID=A0ABS4YTE7_9MICC|nr:1,4-alpha-glucan branching enzyme [Arthrobacter stackebrandtii]
MAGPLLDLLADWLPHQRWYPRKGIGGARLSVAGRIELPSPDPAVRLLVLLVTVDFPPDSDPGQDGPAASPHDAGSGLLLQLPLSIAQDGAPVPHTGTLGAAGTPGGGPDAAAAAADSPACIGWLAPQAGLPGAWVFDGLADRRFVQAWLSVAAGTTGLPGVQLWRNPAWQPDGGEELGSAALVTSEQSNSSVVFDVGGRQLIAKFFRVLHRGLHPEVDVGRALAAGPPVHVPALQAAANWTPGGATLFGVHDFLAGATDGWAVALAAAGPGADFTAHARAIGTELARLHTAMRERMPGVPGRGAAVEDFTRAIGTRLEGSWKVAGPAVGPYGDQLQEVVAQLNQIKALPPLQRIHGDLHLGQLLFREEEPGSGWYFLDFEGEPLRPLAERGRPDVVQRDLAGMLRSFDYAGAQARAGTEPVETAAQWVQDCSRAFLEGYEDVMQAGISRTDPLFVALWLDKALYEVVYELQNRPGWAWVPVNAVRELFHSRKVV